MNSFDTLSMALKNLYKRKLRTFLTVLGVVVGACAIIIMISLGLAINQGFEERMMSTPNATVINIYNYSGFGGHDPFALVLDDEMFDRILQIPDVEAVTPWVNVWGIKSVIGRYVADLQVFGVYPEALPYLGYEIEEGRWLTSEDEWGILFGSTVPMAYMTLRERNDWRLYYTRMYEGDGRAHVNVLRDRIRISVDWSFGEEWSYGFADGYEDDFDPFGDNENTQRAVRPHRVDGVGVLTQGENWESAHASFMNVRTAVALQEEREKWQQNMWGGGSGTNISTSQQAARYDRGFIKCTDVNAIDGVIEELEKLGFRDGEHIWYPASYIKELRDTMASLQMLLGAMGGISLFIATIGISNTMIMSTIERTKEIGVMKVIGASLRDIRKLFLLESAIIGFFGGALGVGVSYLASYFLNENGLDFFKFIDMYNFYGEMQAMKVSIIPFWLSGLSLLFAAVIGLVAGFFPAQRATKLSALAAIRTD
ncbi:MAG: ABC transporter permease [Defluviitaleaceae bacterium]|nr:ABC transporter permease [Defluviitaleaceae bacterium]MCL2835812.1 ABC transporter permease [Defluviitaleaceae bacterium]